jgi:hypothetical protein
MTTVHYQGTQSDLARRASLVLHLTAYAASQGWDTLPVDDADAGLTGIILQPANRLEPIPFLFDAKGRLHALGDLLMPGGDPIYYVAVKTHYAGTAAHQWFTRFLRHIKDTFMPGLTVTDESEYWDHQDEAKLKAYFARLDRLAKNLADHLTHDVAPSSGTDTDNLSDCITLAAEMTHRQYQSHRPPTGAV